MAEIVDQVEGLFKSPTHVARVEHVGCVRSSRPCECVRAGGRACEQACVCACEKIPRHFCEVSVRVLL
jgi:hypothetical protein